MVVFAALYACVMSWLSQLAEAFFRGSVGLMVCWILKWQLKWHPFHFQLTSSIQDVCYLSYFFVFGSKYFSLHV